MSTVFFQQGIAYTTEDMFVRSMPVLQLSRFPNLREEIERLATGNLRDCEEKAKDHCRLLINMELAYMNTNHQDFIGFAR